MQLSLGPVLFCWERQQLLDFYAEMASQPLDVIYLGETVCSKRRALSLDDWLGLAHAALKAATHHGIGQVVLTGGCFANQVLRIAVRTHLERAALQVIEPQWVGCGDEGLALGQAWLAGWFMDKSLDILES